MVLAPPPEPPRLDSPALVAAIPWGLNPVNASYIERLLAMADAHDIRVYWLLYPIHPQVRLGRQQSGWDQAHQDYIRGLQRRFSNLTVLDGTRSTCPLELLGDLTHLNRLGAVAFSTEVADALAALGATDRNRPEPSPSTRWVLLPELRERVATVEVEDDVQSYEALKRIVRAERLQRRALAAETSRGETPQATARR